MVSYGPGQWSDLDHGAKAYRSTDALRFVQHTQCYLRSVQELAIHMENLPRLLSITGP